MNPTRIVVVDDSPLIRQILVDMLRREPDFDVVGYARDGEEALLRIAELSPDVVTLDVEMPRLDGLGCLKELMAARPIPAVMVSTLSPAGAEATFEALLLGAVDFVCKPESGSLSTLRGIREEFVGKVRQAGTARVRQSFEPIAQSTLAAETDRVVLVSTSAGGPRALAALFEGLPQGFAAPTFVAHGLPAPLVGPLARRLNDLGAMPVRVAQPGDRLEPGVALLAPDGGGWALDESGALCSLAGSTGDSIFASAAKVFGARCVAAVLTGGGQDGAEGVLTVRQVGGTVIAESDATCTVSDAPQAAVDTGAVELSVVIEAMGDVLAQAVALDRSQKAAA